MWLFTKRGFFSIVEKQAGEFHIRARIKGDLESLKEFAGSKAKLFTSKDADYRYRLVVTREEAMAIIARLAEDIDYSNFKNRIASDPDQREKLGAYHEVWGTMYGVQRRSENGGV
jgi:hypothetical protein